MDRYSLCCSGLPVRCQKLHVCSGMAVSQGQAACEATMPSCQCMGSSFEGNVPLLDCVLVTLLPAVWFCCTLHGCPRSQARLSGLLLYEQGPVDQGI